MRRHVFFTLLALLAAFVSFSAVPVKAEDACEKHLKITCSNCHTLEQVCARLGNPLQDLKELLNRMILNGAELGRGEVNQMAACLGQPSAAAKAACGK